MPSQRSTSRRTYRSSSAKDYIRDRVDLPLLERLRSVRGDRLSYFGLPGAELKDVKSWGHLLREVAGVERDMLNLEKMDQAVNRDMPDIRFTPHFGEIDLVILTGRGKTWNRGGQQHRPWVGSFRRHVSHAVWQFDVVNLDYFGPFLPEGDSRAAQRARAIRRLFDSERLDSWQPWVLLMTVEARLVTPQFKAKMVDYLAGVESDVPAPASHVVSYLKEAESNDEEEGVAACRLIHGVSASLIARSASHASLSAFHRGTFLYHGSSGQPMVHLAFEFEPQEGPLPPPSPTLQLLKGPLLTTTKEDNPKLALLDGQVPGLTRDDVKKSVMFLGTVEAERLAGEL